VISDYRLAVIADVDNSGGALFHNDALNGFHRLADPELTFSENFASPFPENRENSP